MMDAEYKERNHEWMHMCLACKSYNEMEDFKEYKEKCKALSLVSKKNDKIKRKRQMKKLQSVKGQPFAKVEESVDLTN